MKKFNELKDPNGVAVKTYVEMAQEKAADHGWLTVSVFFNPDLKGDKRFHYVSNIDNFEEVLQLGAAYTVGAERRSAPVDPETTKLVTPEK